MLIIFKLIGTERLKNNPEGSQRKKYLIEKKRQELYLSDFSSETMQARREYCKIFSVEKEY